MTKLLSQSIEPGVSLQNLQPLTICHRHLHILAPEARSLLRMIRNLQPVALFGHLLLQYRIHE